MQNETLQWKIYFHFALKHVMKKMTPTSYDDANHIANNANVDATIKLSMQEIVCFYFSLQKVMQSLM
jgi:hypothetical protein